MKTVMVDLTKFPDGDPHPAESYPGFHVQGFVGSPGDLPAFVLDPDSPGRRERIATALLAAQMTESWALVSPTDRQRYWVDDALKVADMLIAALDKKN